MRPAMLAGRRSSGASPRTRATREWAWVKTRGCPGYTGVPRGAVVTLSPKRTWSARRPTRSKRDTSNGRPVLTQCPYAHPHRGLRRRPPCHMSRTCPSGPTGSSLRLGVHARGCGSFGMAIEAVHVVSDTGASPLRHAQVQGGGHNLTRMYRHVVCVLSLRRLSWSTLTLALNVRVHK